MLVSIDSDKVVPRTEGVYYVTSAGRVYSTDREYYNPLTGGISRRRGKTLKPFIDKDGYERITVSMYGKTTHWRVHNLVVLAYIGPCPRGYQVDHIDNDRVNNIVSNLRYLKQADNVNRKAAHYWHYCGPFGVLKIHNLKRFCKEKNINYSTLHKTWSHNYMSKHGKVIKMSEGIGEIPCLFQ